MKYISIVSMFIIGTFLNLNSYAQDRENKPLPVISPTVLWSLNEATGWVKTTDGQWISAKNKIKSANIASNDPMQDKGHNAIGMDNFSEITARDVTVEGKPFLLITKSLSAGEYKSRLDDDDFFQKPVTVFFVVKKHEAEFNTTQNNGIPDYNLTLYYYGEVATGANTLNDIAIKINEKATANPWISTSRGTDKVVDLVYAPVNGKPETCRFFLMGMGEEVGNGRFLLPFSYTLVGNGEFVYYNRAYFELPTAKFAGLLGLLTSGDITAPKPKSIFVNH